MFKLWLSLVCWIGLIAKCDVASVLVCAETGIEQEVKIDMASIEVYCRQGLEEAEQMGMIEMQAEFLYLGSQLHIINGKPIHKVILILKVISISSLHCLCD